MKALLTALFLLTLASPGCQRSQTAPDSEQMVMATLWYQVSAEARALYYQAFNLAELRVREALDTLPADLPKIVITDIDETILDNSPSEALNILEGARFSPDRWMAWTEKREAAPLPGSLQFAEFLESSGVELYYISNRSEAELEATLDNLKKWGFPFADEDHVLLKKESSDKTSRQDQAASGKHVILLLGDNLADFTGLFDKRGEDFAFGLTDSLRNEFGKKWIVLPNPMYGNWTKALTRSGEKLNPDETAFRRKSYLNSADLK